MVDHYSSATYVQHRFANSNLGVDGGMTVDDDQIEELLDEIDGVINLYLDLDVNMTLPKYVRGLRKISNDLVGMMILQAKFFKNSGTIDTSVVSLWSTVPDFTPSHIRMLEMIRQRTEEVCWNFNTETGDEV